MSNRDLPVENIPQCLRELKQWICWKYVPKEIGKPGKLPVQVNGRNASTTDPKTWSSFDEALAAFEHNQQFAGVAFVFAAQDPFVGIDLDDCLDENGHFIWGDDIVRELATYCEVSPSGRGVKLILRGQKPQNAECIVSGMGPNQDGQIEVYDRARCFVITGQRIDSSPPGVLARQAELDALCAKLWPDKRKPAKTTAAPAPPKPGDEKLQRMWACYKAILGMQLADSGDGSHRLFSACCRCVEYDLPDADAILVIRKYARQSPFPQRWSDDAIAKRLRSAEKKVTRGAAVNQTPAFLSVPLSVGQLLKDYPELRPPVIHGLLRTGETMNVIAPPKMRKSWLVTDLAMAVATGGKWLDTFQTEQGNVLILDNELHRETSANRIPKVAAARGIPLTELADRLFIDNLRGQLQDIHLLQSYFEAIKGGGFKLIVMDAFYRFLPKDSDENSNANITDIYNKLDWYAAMLGCSFVLVHHASKGSQSGKSVTDVGAGAGSQARATDTHLVMRQHEEEDCVVVDAAVRSWHPIEPRCLRWVFPVWNMDDSLDPACLKPDRPRKRPKPKADDESDEPEWTPERFVEAFIGTEASSITTIHAAAKRGGVSQRLSKELLKLAEDAGLVHRWLFGGNRPVKFSTQPQPELIDQSS
jgi:hypothetical protein